MVGGGWNLGQGMVSVWGPRGAPGGRGGTPGCGGSIDRRRRRVSYSATKISSAMCSRGGGSCLVSWACSAAASRHPNSAGSPKRLRLGFWSKAGTTIFLSGSIGLSTSQKARVPGPHERWRLNLLGWIDVLRGAMAIVSLPDTPVQSRPPVPQTGDLGWRPTLHSEAREHKPREQLPVWDPPPANSPQRHSNERTPPLQAKIFETGREWSCLALRETLGSGHQHMSKVVGMPPSWIWQVWHSHPIRRHHLQRVHVCGRGTSPVSTCTYGWTGACENIDRRGEGETLAPNNPHKLNSHLVCRVQHASRSANCLVDRGPSGPSPDSPRSGFAEIRWAFCTGGVEHESQLLARSRITLPALAG